MKNCAREKHSTNSRPHTYNGLWFTGQAMQHTPSLTRIHMDSNFTMLQKGMSLRCMKQTGLIVRMLRISERPQSASLRPCMSGMCANMKTVHSGDIMDMILFNKNTFILQHVKEFHMYASSERTLCKITLGYVYRGLVTQESFRHDASNFESRVNLQTPFVLRAAKASLFVPLQKLCRRQQWYCSD